MVNNIGELLDLLKEKPSYCPSSYTYAAYNEITYSKDTNVFYLRNGDMGYGDGVFKKSTSCVEILISEDSMRGLLQQLSEQSKGKIKIRTNISDRLGSPGPPDYQSYENNVKNYVGEAVVCAEKREDKIIFSYELPEHDQHPWSGW